MPSLTISVPSASVIAYAVFQILIACALLYMSTLPLVTFGMFILLANGGKANRTKGGGTILALAWFVLFASLAGYVFTQAITGLMHKETDVTLKNA